MDHLGIQVLCTAFHEAPAQQSCSAFFFILHWRAVRSRDDHMLHFSLRIYKLGLSILLKSIALLPSRFRVFARKSRTSPGPRHTLDKNGSFKWSVGNRIPSRAIRFELITHTHIYIYIWDYGGHQLRLICAQVRHHSPAGTFHLSRGGVFVGHRPPRDPGDPLH